LNSSVNATHLPSGEIVTVSTYLRSNTSRGSSPLRPTDISFFLSPPPVK